MSSGMDGLLTWVSADELWPRALLGGRGVGSADQLVLGHLGVGFGELQPQGLGDFWIKPDPLRYHRKISQKNNVLQRAFVFFKMKNSQNCMYLTKADRHICILHLGCILLYS